MANGNLCLNVLNIIENKRTAESKLNKTQNNEKIKRTL